MLWRTLPKKEEEKTVAEARRYPSEPQENLLYFMEKNAPLLESATRGVAHCTQGQPVFLSAETDAGDERRLGHFLALHHPEPPL